MVIGNSDPFRRNSIYGGVEYRFEELVLKISNSHDLATAKRVVWRLLHDPEVLRRTIPGCESFEPSGESGRYAASLSVGIGPIRGRFSGSVKLSDLRDGEAYTMELDGQGPTGFVRGTGNIALSETDGGTRVSIEGDAQVGGVLAQVGSRMIETAIRVLMGQFFTAIGDEARDSG